MRDYQTHAIAPKTIIGVASLAIPSGFKTAEVTALAAVTYTGLTLQYDPAAGTYAGTLPAGMTLPGVLTMDISAGQALAVFFRS